MTRIRVHVSSGALRVDPAALDRAGWTQGTSLVLTDEESPPRAAAPVDADDALARSRNLRAMLDAWLKFTERHGLCVLDLARAYRGNERRERWPRKQSDAAFRTYATQLRRAGLIEPTGTTTTFRRHASRRKDHPHADYRVTPAGRDAAARHPWIKE